MHILVVYSPILGECAQYERFILHIIISINAFEPKENIFILLRVIFICGVEIHMPDVKIIRKYFISLSIFVFGS